MLTVTVEASGSVSATYLIRMAVLRLSPVLVIIHLIFATQGHSVQSFLGRWDLSLNLPKNLPKTALAQNAMLLT